MSNLHDVKDHSCVSWWLWKKSSRCWETPGWLIVGAPSLPEQHGHTGAAGGQGHSVKHTLQNTYRLFPSCNIYQVLYASDKYTLCALHNVGLNLDQQCDGSALPLGSAASILHSDQMSVTGWNYLTIRTQTNKSLKWVMLPHLIVPDWSLASVQLNWCFDHSPPEELVMELRLAPNLKEALENNENILTFWKAVAITK